MELHFNKSGNGKPLIILHGLFGMSDNWATLSREYAENGFSVYTIDLRIHGRSSHSEIFTYEAMAGDIAEFITKHKLGKVSLIGHSMGGKVAMNLAASHPQLIEKLIVVDIGVKYYPPHHQTVFAAIHAIDPDSLSNRKDAESVLRNVLKEEATIQFLLKNLYWSNKEKLDWRFNATGIEKNIEEVGKALPGSYQVHVPTLFVSGERSGYISQDDLEGIRSQFNDVEFVTIPNAGHWVHAENPQDFFKVTLDFLE